MAARTRCRALVAGFGRPGGRDLDFGRQLVRYLEGFDWPEGVVVEDLSYAAPLVLHRLQELEPAKVVLVGAVARDFDPPGALRRYRLAPTPPGPEEVRRSLEESVQGVVDIDHTLAVVRHWGTLPAETVVIEVEPADCSFGPGFSEELAAAFDPILEMVREELDAPGAPAADFDLDSVQMTALDSSPGATACGSDTSAPSEGLTELARYARQHEQLRRVQRDPNPFRSVVPEGVEVAGRSRPWGVGIDSGSDWFDVIPLEGRWLGVVVGEATGRGVEAAGVMADLRAALRAYAVLTGSRPAQVLHHLDRLVGATGLGEGATLVYVALQPVTGELRLANAGHCPLLVLPPGSEEGRFLRDGLSGPLAAGRTAEREEARLFVPPGSTLLLFTDGLVQSRSRSMTDGLERLRQAATSGPRTLDQLCDHVLDVCNEGLRRDDDISLLAVRLLD